jgi:hypothetical protein
LLSEEFESLLRQCEPRAEPEYLYHYCHADTLEKILKSQSLWASDLRTMKDSTEIHYGYGVLEAACKRSHYLLGIGPAADRLRQMCLTHVACLSLRVGIKNQWEEYAAKSTGAAIGIRFQEMRRIAGGHLGRLFHFPMVYDPSVQSHFLDELISRASRIEHTLASAPLADVETYRDHVIMHIGAAVATLKDPGYAPEEEWRLAIDCETEEFTKIDRGPICCRALPVCTPAAVGEIVLGPQSAITIDQAREIAKEANMPDVIFRKLNPGDLTD